jgi:hypothetical protein
MEDDRELLENLRVLAADGPFEAPARVELRLLAEFRKRNKWRRVRMWASLGAVAMAAGIVLSLWVREASKPATAVAPLGIEVAQTSDEDVDAGFYPLPEAEALPAVESATVVRVQLPASSLRLMGVPVDEQGDAQGSDTAVQAELLLGQDGLARGVRLAE